MSDQTMNLAMPLGSRHSQRFFNHPYGNLPAGHSFVLVQTLEGTDKDPRGYLKYKDRMRIDEEEHHWFQTRLFHNDFLSTRGAILTRLDGFTADPLFRRMFRNPRNKLDLYQELQNGRVILVNTNKGLLKDATEADTSA